ncbi:hypothetical protein AB3M93_11225 [Novosphingobium panipatense]|uniref:hypothetical protein n=1 Tax=Novosphingobium TaxID=165696 RepID=UPI0011AEC8B0|nr:hypothetical protein [Novosphingobium sp. HII-3]
MSNQFRRNTSFTAESTLFGWKRIDHNLYRQDLVRHTKVEERLFNDIVRNSGAMRRDVKNTTKMGLSYRGRVLGKYPASSPLVPRITLRQIFTDDSEDACFGYDAKEPGFGGGR